MKEVKMKLTHLDKNNRAKMVDVSNKQDSIRVAKASGTIKMSQEAYETINANQAKKGPVLQTAVIAAIMGAKKTGDLIPMCHPLMLSSIDCDIAKLDNLPGFRLEVTAKLIGKTGVEMEALMGVSIGLLTIYDMIKAIDKSMIISDIKLISKQGGKSGNYTAM